MFSFTDTNVLTAAQLNGNFNNALDKTASGSQTIVSPIVVNGGITTSALTVNGPSTFVGAEIAQTVILTAAGNYAIGPSDRYILVNKTTGAATQVTLPSSAAVGRVISVKDAKGDAATNNVTVVPSGADTIDGAASKVFSTNYASAKFIYIGSNWSVL